MPLWSEKALASGHCTDEWANYIAVEITLEDFLEEWVSDLNDDGVLIGIDWVADEDCQEMDPIILATSLVDIEKDS